MTVNQSLLPAVDTVNVFTYFIDLLYHIARDFDLIRYILATSDCSLELTLYIARLSPECTGYIRVSEFNDSENLVIFPVAYRFIA